MTDHLTARAIASYRERTLSPEELLALDDHLQVCRECRERIAQPDRLAAEVAFLKRELREESAALHPFYEELAAYVDGGLDEVDSEVVRSHLDLCARCEAELKDLVDLKSRISTLSEPSGRRRYGWLAAAAAVLALAAVGAFLVARADVERLEMEVAQLGAENERVRSEYESARSEIERLQARLPEPEPQSSPSPEVERIADAGRTITLGPSGNVQGVDGLPPGHRALIGNALSTGRIEASPLLAGLVQAAGTLRGGGEGAPFALLSPVGTVVRSIRPTFRWSPRDGATRYVVSVYDESFRLVVDSPPLRTTEWTPDAGFEPGEVYQWQVKADRAGMEVLSPAPPAAPARFRLLDSDEAEELAAAEGLYGGSHLLMGLLYAQAGLLDESEEELRLLRQENPESHLVRDLLRSVSNLRQPRR